MPSFGVRCQLSVQLIIFGARDVASTADKELRDTSYMNEDGRGKALDHAAIRRKALACRCATANLRRDAAYRDIRAFDVKLRSPSREAGGPALRCVAAGRS